MLKRYPWLPKETSLHVYCCFDEDHSCICSLVFKWQLHEDDISALFLLHFFIFVLVFAILCFLFDNILLLIWASILFATSNPCTLRTYSFLIKESLDCKWEWVPDAHNMFSIH
ncbi:hypothetical protein ACJX0J_020400, partial [Zea mays]